MNDEPNPPQPIADTPPRLRTVLHVGCGTVNASGLHSSFPKTEWREVRIDIDPNVKPDVVASLTNLDMIPSGSADAIWSSHNIEHLYDHEISLAFNEFHRVLRPDGFAFMTLPDLQAVAKLIVDGRVEEVVYTSPAGPITALDMIFGHRKSIENGNKYMSHNTGFTRERLARVILNAGFPRAIVSRGNNYDLWALAMMPDAPPNMRMSTKA